ncbi:MAG: hypothetical protein JWM02_915 [Frankiales bacterium]|nr:hypothetical protein [Frankiales bacterium]
MVLALAFVPSPPLLLDALGGGSGELRSACLQAISVLDSAERVVVLGAAPSDGWVTGHIDATPYGAPGTPAADPLPLALAVGSTLMGDRPHHLYGVAGGLVPDLGGRTGLLVVGDGSARRTEKAPGHFDERAESFDRQIENAFAAGDPDLLAALDRELAEDLMVGGLTSWRAAASAARHQMGPGGCAPLGWSGQVHLAAAPYGVGYFVASWTPRPT